MATPKATPKRRHMPRRPDLDERFSLPEDTDAEEVLRRLVATPQGSEGYADDGSEDGPEPTSA